MPSTLSLDAKDALAHDIPQTEHCREALRCGLLLYGTTQGSPLFSTQRLAVARLARTLFGSPPRKIVHSHQRGLQIYTIDIAELIPTRVPKPHTRCDRRMELRAAFLACGLLAHPQRGYHLEFTPGAQAATQRLFALLQAEGFAPKQTPRKQRTAIYFKSIDDIVQVLTAIGAFNAVCLLEDTRALKETKNRIHRLVNTEAANVDRTVNAAARQREIIAFLADAYGLQHLSAGLREIAELRLAHPTETLAELGRRCDPPTNKSTAGARFLALSRLAAKVSEATIR
jgi:DNA-binding protein WhiA